MTFANLIFLNLSLSLLLLLSIEEEEEKEEESFPAVLVVVALTSSVFKMTKHCCAFVSPVEDKIAAYACCTSIGSVINDANASRLLLMLLFLSAWC